MDGDFRSQAARMPPWLRPDRIETPKRILLVKSDFEKRLGTIRCAASCRVWLLMLPTAGAPLTDIGSGLSL